MRKLKSVIAKSTERMFHSGEIYILKGVEYEVVSGDEDYFKIKDESHQTHVFDSECQHLFEFIYEGDQEDAVRKFTIERVYDIDDVDFMGDVQEIRLREGDVEIISGVASASECLDHKIDGFFKAINHLGIKYEMVIDKLNEAFR